jgi:Pilus formation protein N terminal region
MVEQRAEGRFGAGLACAMASAICLAAFFAATPRGFADQLALSVERPQRQAIVLTQGFSTTIHGERPFGKVSITDPEIVDLVLRTDKSAVLIPQRLGRTNIDFLDDHGNLMGSMEVRVVRQSVNDRVVIYNRPSLGAFSTFHCGASGCEHFEEMPAKEEALTPGVPQNRAPMGIPMMGIPH